MFCIYFCLRGIISNGILWSGRIDLLVRPDHFMVGPKTTRHRLSGIVACLLTPTPAFHFSLTIATYLLSFIHSFIHSFIYSVIHAIFYNAFSSPLLLRSAPDTARILLEFHAEAPQATVSERLAQGS